MEIETVFQEFAVSLSASLKAGYSLQNGFEEALAEMKLLHGEKNLLVKELKRVIRAMREGGRCEDMLVQIGEELDCQSMEDFGNVLLVSNLVGGDRAQILNNTVKLLQSKHSIRQEIEDGIAGRRFEAKIMEFVPFLLVLYVEWGNPDYFQMMFSNLYGKVWMSGCLVSYVVAKVWMYIIVDDAVEV